MEQQLAYSFHLGSDKNKSKLAKKVSKGNVSGTTSLSNNAIQKLDNLKPAKFNKNNMGISNEDIQKIKDFTKDVKDTTKTVRSVNDLNIAIRDFEHSAKVIIHLIKQLKEQELKILINSITVDIKAYIMEKLLMILLKEKD